MKLTCELNKKQYFKGKGQINSCTYISIKFVVQIMSFGEGYT